MDNCSDNFTLDFVSRFHKHISAYGYEHLTTIFDTSAQCMINNILFKNVQQVANRFQNEGISCFEYSSTSINSINIGGDTYLINVVGRIKAFYNTYQALSTAIRQGDCEKQFNEVFIVRYDVLYGTKIKSYVLNLFN